ncbi:hypothetical protein [Variovorax boronicumulans]
MKSTALALLFCLGLLSAGCDDKPKPGGPVPKASASVVTSVLLAS